MKVLIVDDIHEVFLQKLKEAHIVFDYRPDMNLEQASAVIGAYAGLVIRSKFRVGKAFIDHAERLVFVARAGAGLDNIEEDYAAAKGIVLLNAPEGNRQAVAEHMTGMLLGLMNNFRQAQQQIAKGEWLREENRGTQLHGKTVALIGYGHNGQAMARCLSGFGVELLAYDKYRNGFGDSMVQEVGMDEIFARADVLSLHIPLTSETRQLVDSVYLERFYKPIFLLNGARGPIVDPPAVLAAIRAGRVRAAALDVLPVESFPALEAQTWFEELSNHPQVMLTPHIAGWTTESYYDIALVLADKIIQFCDKNG